MYLALKNKTKQKTSNHGFILISETQGWDPKKEKPVYRWENSCTLSSIKSCISIGQNKSSGKQYTAIFYYLYSVVLLIKCEWLFVAEGSSTCETFMDSNSVESNGWPWRTSLWSLSTLSSICQIGLNIKYFMCHVFLQLFDTCYWLYVHCKWWVSYFGHHCHKDEDADADKLNNSSMSPSCHWCGSASAGFTSFTSKLVYLIFLSFGRYYGLGVS